MQVMLLIPSFKKDNVLVCFGIEGGTIFTIDVGVVNASIGF
jgi:hypothetical protein